MATLRMFVFVYGVLFSVHFISYVCEGKIISPPDGKELTFLPGSSENITWIFDDDISEVSSRTWTFTSSDGLRPRTIGLIPLNLQPVPTDNLPGINLLKPATLELNNVNHSYDGIYTFVLATSVPETHTSEVKVYIAKKPDVKIECSSSITVNKSDDFTCICRGEGGNPPANVTWYKKDVQIGETKKENNTLTLTDVNVTDSGTYTCVALSYPTDAYKDEKSIRITVNSEPYDTTITLKPPVAAVGETVIIECESKGVPSLSYRITHVDTERVHNVKTLTIFGVQFNDTGTYECFVWNTLGNDSNSDNLTVEESRPTEPSSKPTIPNKKSTTDMKGEKPSNEATSGTEWYVVVVSLVSGIFIGILLSYIVWCLRRRWFRNEIRERNPEPQTTEVDTTYQELDLTKMKKEDNYQSLKVTAASNDAANENNSTYTQLTKSRDVENNYQSLT